MEHLQQRSLLFSSIIECCNQDHRSTQDKRPPRLTAVSEEQYNSHASSGADFNEFLQGVVQDLHTDFNREVLDPSLRIQMQPIENVLHKSVFTTHATFNLCASICVWKIVVPIVMWLRRYFGGFVNAAVIEIRLIFQAFLEVEDIFHSSDINVPGLVIHAKRPEYEPHELLKISRSHQALKTKNRLILNLLEAIKKTPGDWHIA